MQVNEAWPHRRIARYAPGCRASATSRTIGRIGSVGLRMVIRSRARRGRLRTDLFYQPKEPAALTKAHTTQEWLIWPSSTFDLEPVLVLA